MSGKEEEEKKVEAPVEEMADNQDSDRQEKDKSRSRSR